MEVGPSSKVTIPEGCEVIDYKESTIIPGFIDAHTHLTLSAQISNYAAAMKDDKYVLLLRGARNMYCDLLSGVTTMRCLGEIDNIDVALKDASEKA